MKRSFERAKTRLLTWFPAMWGQKPGSQDSQAVETQALRPESPPWQMESIPTGSTCPVCSTLPLQDPPTGTGAPSLEYFVNLDPQHREAIKEWYQRCYLVRLVYDLGRYWSGESNGHEFVEQRGNRYEYTCSTNPLWDSNSGSARQYMSVNLDNFLSRTIEGVVVHADPLSRPSVAHLQHWVDTCNKNHEKCKFTSNTKLPTRVLDIQDLKSVKLHHSGRQRDRYIALSHCWGASKPFITTHSTIDEMKKGFSLEDAPKTFQDAILVTHALRIRYLWIDSLCIIQDDTKDWRIESSKMSEVYTNSYLTIAAANADEDAKGFLSLRPFKYASLELTSAAGKSAQVYLQKSYGLSITSHGPQPLDARAWTLQEQFLSPRTVRFCNEQMTWICKQDVYAEAQRSAQAGFMQYSVESIWGSSWTDLVAGFSRRALTYDTDKLPALAGLVTSLAESYGKRYCAGLWQDEMPYCLLWQRKEDGQVSSKYLAPSWSWASINGPISYEWVRSNILHTPGNLKSVVLHHYHIQTSKESPYGAVQEGAYLRLTAPLAPLKPSANSDRGIIGRVYYEFNHPKDNDVEVWCSFDLARKETRDILGLILAYGYRTPRPRARRPWDHNYDEERNPVENLPHNWTNFYGLLVCRSGHAENTYERIGSFEVFEMKTGKAISILENHLAKEVTLY